MKRDSLGAVVPKGTFITDIACLMLGQHEKKGNLKKGPILQDALLGIGLMEKGN
ncbi:MAG: hypothetical protein U0987_03035 [Afipia sp.]|uniref:hypothetical protein n=1 Tax=Parvibaculum sp. TaxID=2024848 RepID=UPI00272F677C|nr:hypothetical protein [Parvibaculum sp.]MDP2149564.1 hypothetical protein [Parvibaculum sp.]MDZ4365994.1 hypothetical protein [Afipia sp.]